MQFISAITISLLFSLMHITSATNPPYSAVTRWLSTSDSSTPTSTGPSLPLLRMSNTTGTITTSTTTSMSYTIPSQSSSAPNNQVNSTSTISSRPLGTATGSSGLRVGNSSNTAVYTSPTSPTSSTTVQVYAGSTGKTSIPFDMCMAVVIATVALLLGERLS